MKSRGHGSHRSLWLRHPGCVSGHDQCVCVCVCNPGFISVAGVTCHPVIQGTPTFTLQPEPRPSPAAPPPGDALSLPAPGLLLPQACSSLHYTCWKPGIPSAGSRTLVHAGSGSRLSTRSRDSADWARVGFQFYGNCVQSKGGALCLGRRMVCFASRSGLSASSSCHGGGHGQPRSGAQLGAGRGWESWPVSTASRWFPPPSVGLLLGGEACVLSPSVPAPPLSEPESAPLPGTSWHRSRQLFPMSERAPRRPGRP